MKLFISSRYWHALFLVNGANRHSTEFNKEARGVQLAHSIAATSVPQYPQQSNHSNETPWHHQGNRLRCHRTTPRCDSQIRVPDLDGGCAVASPVLEDVPKVSAIAVPVMVLIIIVIVNNNNT